MTSYTCKRLCCSVDVVFSPRGIHNVIKLNGTKVSAAEIATKAGVGIQSIHRRISAKRCLQVHRESGNRRPKQKPVDARSESDRLAALFNKLPRVAA